ncbi:DegT/DnrJ/EryC1/StrS family aminotransferase, partial [Saccharospirillum sp. MSK14-1]|uniref:DegT/DnrJ/EryC1/StrS family aminotransferase n=1 Tax=Saccharospirillum sp. MSK14-1 TaxID=1897632 RepID=UPI0011B27141
IIRRMPEQVKMYVYENVKAYRFRSRHPEFEYNQQISDDINLMSALLKSRRSHRMLRYPVLMKNAEQRQHLLDQLKRKGLGVSGMYETALIDIDCVSDLPVRFNATPNAIEFSRRFLTLPTHVGVSRAIFIKITEYLK